MALNKNVARVVLDDLKRLVCSLNYSIILMKRPQVCIVTFLMYQTWILRLVMTAKVMGNINIAAFMLPE